MIPAEFHNVGLPRFYGKPIDTPTGHKWSGYATDAPRTTVITNWTPLHVTARLTRNDVLRSLGGDDTARDPLTGDVVKRATGYPAVR